MSDSNKYAIYDHGDRTQIFIRKAELKHVFDTVNSVCLLRGDFVKCPPELFRALPSGKKRPYRSEEFCNSHETGSIINILERVDKDLTWYTEVVDSLYAVAKAEQAVQEEVRKTDWRLDEEDEEKEDNESLKGKLESLAKEGKTLEEAQKIIKNDPELGQIFEALSIITEFKEAEAAGLQKCLANVFGWCDGDLRGVSDPKVIPKRFKPDAKGVMGKIKRTKATNK